MKGLVRSTGGAKEKIDMKFFGIVLAFCLVAGTGEADEVPVPYAGGGGMNPLDFGVRIWTDTPNFDGLLGSSEQIPGFDLTSELANDFLIEIDVTILCWTWFGGYYGIAPGDPLVESFILRVYSDDDGQPDAVLFEFTVPSNANETYIYDQGGLPIYEYVHVDEVSFDPGHYWLGLQAGSHPFPPQWGRLAADFVQLHPTVFRSQYFSYPSWTPAEAVFGQVYEASVWLEDDCYAPVETTTWGAIKGLYR